MSNMMKFWKFRKDELICDDLLCQPNTKMGSLVEWVQLFWICGQKPYENLYDDRCLKDCDFGYGLSWLR